jgi:hypothetical protein
MRPATAQNDFTIRDRPLDAAQHVKPALAWKADRNQDHPGLKKEKKV